MKPIKLVISGWGPYKDREEIDFTALSGRGIFLITGQTGAGKTTIFDAITYALYGDLSGSLRQKATVRSDFADVQTQTFVEFEMEHEGHRYRIRRNPEYQRPRKRKGGKESFVTEKENAVLEFEDGGALEGNREVNEKIREILRLDLRQFRQISMIAQGEFAQLLHAGGDEKMKIFREIFGTSVYDLFLKKLKERAAAQEKKATAYLHRMEEDVRLFPAEDERFKELTKEQPYPYREIAALLGKMEQEARKEAEAAAVDQAVLEEDVRTRTAGLALAERTNERFLQLEKQQDRQRELAAKREEMELLENTCLRAQAAAKVYEIYRQVVQTQADWERQREQLKRQRLEMEQLEKEQQTFAPAAEKEADLETLFSLWETAQQESQRAKATQEAQERARVLLEQAQRIYLQAEQKMQEQQRILENLQTARQHSMIGLVATLVREGEPCPVCGSLEHPKVAAAQDGPDEEQIKRAEKALELARGEQMKRHGEARAAFELHEKQKQEADSAKEAAESATKSAKEQEEGLSQVIGQIQNTQPASAQQKDSHPNSVLARNAFRQRMRRFHENEAAIAERKKNCLQAEENINLLKQRLESLQAQLKEQKRQQGFAAEDSDTSWKNALLDEKTQRAYQQQLAGYREEVRACAELIGHLEEELAGKSPADVTNLRDALKEMQNHSQALLERLQKLRIAQQTAGNTARSLNENLKRSGEAQAVYGVVKDLENMASGNNPRRLVFEQYVLAGYFDDILRAANLRLKNMSGGRYELFRADKISDGRKKDSLEIEVMDYYTGKRRSVRTLSGGETFKASLSLALGLSDAVCAENGGVKVETLFVDEGFGALDSQSLDQACDVLMRLAGENRLIGIISHVGELKERIPVQIVVEREIAGSRITVRS